MGISRSTLVRGLCFPHVHGKFKDTLEWSFFHAFKVGMGALIIRDKSLKAASLNAFDYWFGGGLDIESTPYLITERKREKDDPSYAGCEVLIPVLPDEL